MPLTRRRVSLRAPSDPGDAMPPTPELPDYAGRYDSGALGTCAEVTTGERGVAVRFGRGSLSRLELAAAAPDVFRTGAMVARFHRDAGGAVVAFSYSDPLLRGLRFTRQGAD